MNISRNLNQVFQRLDTNHDGLSLQELQGLNKAAGAGGDGDDFQLSAEEASAAGITDAQDLDVINQALSHAKEHQMSPSQLMFPALEGEYTAPVRNPLGSAFAQSLANDLSNGAYADGNPDVRLRLERLESSFQSGVPQGIGQYTMISPNSAVSGIDLNALDGVQNLNDIRQAARQSLAASMGGNPSDAQVDAYLNEHFDEIAAQLGEDLNGRYNGLVKFTGDADGMTAFQTPGADDIIVCTDIHASLAAFRQSMGQEAYIVSTSDNDSAHVFTVFKDGDTWNIQNYGKVIRTDAKDLRELYDRYLPNQRTIRLFSVGENGEIQQERKVKTATGWREWDFRNQLGAGNYNPETAQDGVQMGMGPNGPNGGMSVTYGRFNFNFNPQNNTLGLNYHVREQDQNSRRIEGAGLEIQDNTTDQGYRTRRVDAKYERRTTTTEEHSPGHVSQTQSHLNVHVGVETTPGEPIYWQDASDGGTAVGGEDTALRFGALWRRNSNHFFGGGPFKLDLGYGHALGATGTLSVTPQEASDVYQLYSGRMYNDLTAELHGNLGFLYQPNSDLMIRAGVTPGLNLANLDGFRSFEQQMGNMTELNAYGELRWTPGNWTFGAMGNVDLLHPGVFQVGGLAEYNFNNQFAWSTQFMHNNDPLLGDRTGVRSDLLFRPTDNTALTLGGGWMMDQMPMLNAGFRVNFDPLFGR